MATTNIKTLGAEKKLGLIIERAAKLLPGDVGRQLLAIVTPTALAILATTVTVWAAAHFFGVGEIADLILLITGYVALGGIAFEAAGHIVHFVKLTTTASTEADLDAAAKHLATAISLVGVQTVLVILFRKRPGDMFKPVHGRKIPSLQQWVAQPLARNGGLSYKPKLMFTRKKDTGTGATNIVGDIRIGRFPGEGGRQEMMAAIFHERVHQFLSPKFYLLRNIRIYAKQSGYQRSFLLRYIEEAMAETIARLRAYGWSRESVFQGLIFPLGQHYTITITNLRSEASGILLGPIVAGGMVFQVFYGVSKD